MSSYTVIFNVNDREKFMKTVGGQILELMRKDSREEIGAFVMMVGDIDYRKYEQYVDYISELIARSPCNLPTFDEWEDIDGEK